MPHYHPPEITPAAPSPNEQFPLAALAFYVRQRSQRWKNPPSKGAKGDVLTSSDKQKWGAWGANNKP